MSNQEEQVEIGHSQDTLTIAPGEIVIGAVAGIDQRGRPLVTFAQQASVEPLAALSTVGINHGHIGRQVALLFADGNADQPVIMGLIHSPLQELLVNFENAEAARPAALAGGALDEAKKANHASIDGERVVLEGKEEIVLKCGEASITLTKAGKILIRGKYLLSRSTGVNRILGGSVQVN